MQISFLYSSANWVSQVTFLFYNLQEKMAVMDEMEQRLATSNLSSQPQSEQKFTVQSV